MSSSRPVCGLWKPAAALSFSLLFAAAPALATTFEDVAYELGEGSMIFDECLFCDRAPIELPLRGTCVLTRLPVRLAGELYAISSIDFQALSPIPEGAYAVNGTGTLLRIGENFEDQTLELDLEVNGTEDVKLSSGPIKATAPWPAIDLVASEDGTRDEFHVYRVRLVAAPSAKQVRYTLAEGNENSFFLDECLPCGRPTIQIPIGGSFLLTEVDSGGPNPVRTYRVDSVDFRSLLEGQDYHITGSGTYHHGGEVALLQDMDLSVMVNGTKADLASISVPVEAPFPEIAITLEHRDPPTVFSVYTLRIVARPSDGEGPRFRRADSNGDESVDIADAVFTLLWKFSGGTAPGCLEAADSNGDAAVDLTDAVFTLIYLFQSGAAPPAPGPADCGAAPKASLVCESSPCL